MKPSEIFGRISTRQVEGMMLHDQMADAFAFLTLPGFEKLHEKQYHSESAEMRCLHRYYINHMDMLMADGRPDDPRALPKSWAGYTRQQVTTDTKRKAVREMMERWVSWETETRGIYQECYMHLTDCGEIAAACEVKRLLLDVDEELCRAKELHLRLEAVMYDMPTIEQMQGELMEA